MNWLVGATIASALSAVLLVGLYDYFVAGLLGTAAVGVVKLGLFSGTWTAITTGLGMRKYSKGVQHLREKTSSEDKRLERKG